ESNRLELIAANLRAVGVEAEARGNDLFVCGTTRRPSGRIETARDHRLAMAFAVLGTLPGAEVRLSERASVAISYPRFFGDLRHIGKGERGKGKGWPSASSRSTVPRRLARAPPPRWPPDVSGGRTST